MLKRRAITLFARTNNPEMFSNCFDVEEIEKTTESMKNVTPAETTIKEVKPNVVEAKKVVTVNNNDKGYF